MNNHYLLTQLIILKLHCILNMPMLRLGKAYFSIFFLEHQFRYLNYILSQNLFLHSEKFMLLITILTKQEFSDNKSPVTIL